MLSRSLAVRCRHGVRVTTDKAYTYYVHFNDPRARVYNPDRQNFSSVTVGRYFIAAVCRAVDLVGVDSERMSDFAVGTAANRRCVVV